MSNGRGRSPSTPEKYGNDPNTSRACEPVVAPRKCSATTDAESAASLQAGGPGFDSPCLHPGKRPFPLDGKGLFPARAPAEYGNGVHRTSAPNWFPRRLSGSGGEPRNAGGSRHTTRWPSGVERNQTAWDRVNRLPTRVSSGQRARRLARGQCPVPSTMEDRMNNESAEITHPKFRMWLRRDGIVHLV